MSKSDSSKDDQTDTFQRVDSDELIDGAVSQADFKMIFMSSSYSDRNQSKEFRLQNPTMAGSTQLSVRTFQTAQLTASLRKAISSMKIHSWKTDYVQKVSSSVQIYEPNNVIEKIGSHQVDWYQEFSCAGPIVNIKNIFLYNKLFARIRIGDTASDILQLMLRGVTIFCYNLHYGSTEDHNIVLNRVTQSKKMASRIKDIPFVFFVVPEISYRLPMIGKLKPGLKYINLRTGTKVIITCDRSYAWRCSKKVIYINFRHYIQQLRRPDTIQIGDVNLRVRKTAHMSVECDVLMGGKITAKMEVHLPVHSRPDANELSFEEIEDLTYMMSKGINCFLLPLAGNKDYLGSFKKALKLLKAEDMRIMARVYEEEVLDGARAKWIANNYDAVVLECGSCPCSNRTLLQTTKNFMKICYDKKRPIIMQCLHARSCVQGCSQTVSDNDFDYFFFYPDGYYLSDVDKAASFQLIHRSVEIETVEKLERIALEKLEGPFVDRSSTGSDTMARVIAKMSYQLEAKAILICSASGRMAMKISHFRPKCPIVVLTKNHETIRYLKLFHNVRIAFYQEMEEAKKMQRSDLLIARLLHGLVHGLTLNIFEHDDTILFCYKHPPDIAYANIVVPFKLDATTVRKYFDNFTAQTV